MSLFQSRVPSQKENELNDRLKLQEILRPSGSPPQPEQPLTEPFVGWRLWLVDNGKLGSMTRSDVHWPYRKALQADDPNWHLDGRPNGIHACRFRQDILGSYYPSYVLGMVYLWGRVQKFSMGFRAEFAYPKELFVHNEFDPLKIMELEENYGVPVSFAEDLQTASQYAEIMRIRYEQHARLHAAQQAQLQGQANQLVQNVPAMWQQAVPTQIWGYGGVITGGLIGNP